MLAIAAEPLISCSFILRWLFWFPLYPLLPWQKSALRSVLGFTCASCASLTVCRTNHCVRACVCVCMYVRVCVSVSAACWIYCAAAQATGSRSWLCFSFISSSRSSQRANDLRRAPFTFYQRLPVFYARSLPTQTRREQHRERVCLCVCVWARSLAACALRDIEVGFSFEFNVTLRRRELWESSERKTYKAGSYRLSISLQRSYRLQTPTLSVAVSLSHALSLARSLDLPLI